MEARCSGKRIRVSTELAKDILFKKNKFIYKIMRHVTLSIPDNKYPLFMELARSLNFVKKIEVDEDSSKVKTIPNFEKSLKMEYVTLLDSLEVEPEQGTSIGNSCYKIRLAMASKGKGKVAGPE